MISLIQKLGPQATAQSLIQGLPPHIKDQLKTLDPNAIQAFIDTINEESDWDTGIKKARKDRRQKADFDEANKHRAYTIQLVEMFHGKGHHLWAIVAEYRQRLRERNLLNDQAYLASQSK